MIILRQQVNRFGTCPRGAFMCLIIISTMCEEIGVCMAQKHEQPQEQDITMGSSTGAEHHDHERWTLCLFHFDTIRA